MPVEGKLAPDGRTKLRSGGGLGVKGQERRAQRRPGHHLRSCLLIKRLCSELVNLSPRCMFGSGGGQQNERGTLFQHATYVT